MTDQLRGDLSEPEHPGRDTAPRHQVGRHLAVLLGFVVLGMLWARALLADPVHRTLAGGKGDASLFLWFLAHTSRAVLHDGGHGLLVTHDLNVPAGVNVMWNTSLLLPGLLLAPVTDAAGPVLSLNILIIAGPVLSSWSAYLCSGRFLSRTSARALCGLLFGFSPALVAASVGHYHLTLLPLVPPILLTVVDAATGRRRPLPAGALLGVLLSAQVLIGEEVLALTGIAAVLLLVVLGVQHRDRMISRLRPVLVTGAVAAVATGLLAGYPLLVQFAGPQRVHGAASAPDKLLLDPAQLVVPSQFVGLQSSAVQELLHPWRLSPAENMGYVGLPLLLLLTAFACRRREDPVVRATAVSAAVLTVLALGNTLHLAGRPTGLPLPWKPLSSLPVLTSVLPVRWMLLVDLFLALLLGALVEGLPRRGPRSVLGAALVLGAVLPAVPLQTGTGSGTGTPPWFTSTQAASQRDPVLVVPVPNQFASEAMTWVAEAKARFPIPGGYFIGPHAGGVGSFGPYPQRPTDHLLQIVRVTDAPLRVTRAMRAQAAADLAHWGARTIVLGPAPQEAAYLRFLTDLVGRSPDRVEGVWIWRDVDEALAADAGTASP